MYPVFTKYLKLVWYLTAALSLFYIFYNININNNDQILINNTIIEKTPNILTTTNTKQHWELLIDKTFVTTTPVNASVVFFLFFCFFFVNVLITLFHSYLTINGVVYLGVFCCTFLLIGFLLVYQQLTIYGVVPFFELKIYSIYNPIYTTAITFSLDYLSTAFMFLVVSIAIAALFYSRVYLYSDPFITDFVVKLLWFVFSMLSLVLSKNFIFLYFSWEFIGITSMWLINFNSQRIDTNKSALKAFTFNKLSDLCLFSALLLSAWAFNSPTITDWKLELYLLNSLNINNNIITLISVLFIIAACIKSAQLGMHLWLPDSMDAPVPASALIHSATLVSAGIYLLLRFLDVINFSGTAEITCVLGALTAVYGGVVAGAQTDLKRALAYSTISHCGFLFVASIIGGSDVALLYLFLHGFYKALSFICAGESIRSSLGYQDLNKMGGLFYVSPSLSAQFFVAMGNLCGLPFFIGYLYKSNFQLLLLTNSNFLGMLNFLLFFGFLSSLFYFLKVFYSVTFTFKKNNYKSYSEFFKLGFYSSKYPLKNPTILIFIFWFILLVSLVCILYIFNYEVKALQCSYLDNINLSLSFAYLYASDPLNATFSKLSYFFLFYVLFAASTIIIWFTYLQNRCVGVSTITKQTYFMFVCVLLFLFI